jgi:hypothetical protein
VVIGDKDLVLHLDGAAHDQLAAAASRAGVSVGTFALDAIVAVSQEDEALHLTAAALDRYGEVFGLDPIGNAAKIAQIRSRIR